ncbi:Nucleic acid dioxygenase ALKBH1 [Balamuthia mandrillaris]
MDRRESWPPRRDRDEFGGGGGGYIPRGGGGGFHHASPSYRRRSGDRYGGGGDRGGNKRGDRYGARDQGGSDYKRRRYDEAADIEQRLRSLIVKIGDNFKSGSSLESNLQGLAQALESDLTTHRKQILDTLSSCIANLPVKAGVYGTLVGLINTKDAAFGKEVVARVMSALQQGLDGKDAPSVKCHLRFLAELVNANVILPTSFLDVVQPLLALLQQRQEDEEEREDEQKKDEEEEEANEERRRKVGRAPPQFRDVVALALLKAIPFVAREFVERCSDRFERAWHILEDYIQDRAHNLAPAFRAIDVYPLHQEAEQEQDHNYLLWLWRRYEELKDADWRFSSVLHPYPAFQSTLNSAIQHDVSSLSLKSLGEWGIADSKKQLCVGLTPLRPIFRLFKQRDSNTEATSFDRQMLEDYMIDLMHFFSGDHKLCAKFLLNLPFPEANYDQILVENIFAQMLQLPKAAYPGVFYSVLISDLCKTHPTFPPQLGQAIITLFERVEQMDPECTDRLSSWFSHHLSNFDYKWNWSYWAHVLEMGEDEPKRLFVKEVLEQCVRLAYWDRVRRTIPDEFEALMPPKPTPTLKYSGDGSSSEEQQQKAGEQKHFRSIQRRRLILLQMIRERQQSTQIKQWLDDGAPLQDNKKGEEEEEEEEEDHSLSQYDSMELVIHCLLEAGSKSFSHMLNILERYNPLLRLMANDQTLRVQCLAAVADFWQNSSQHVSIVFDKLMTYLVADNVSIVEWLFSSSVLPHFTRRYTREILRNTIEKTIARTQTLTQEVQALQQSSRREENEEIEKKLNQANEALNAALQEQKELFLKIFQVCSFFNLFLPDTNFFFCSDSSSRFLHILTKVAATWSHGLCLHLPS